MDMKIGAPKPLTRLSVEKGKKSTTFFYTNLLDMDAAFDRAVFKTKKALGVSKKNNGSHIKEFMKKLQVK